MKKAGIITIIDKTNFGNRLQNYALSYYCNNILKIETYTLENHDYLNNRRFLILRVIKHFLRTIKNDQKSEKILDKENNFLLFDKNIKYYKKQINAYTNLNQFDYLIVGSDQIWNPNFRRLRDVDTLKFVTKSKKISYAASFGVEEISDKYRDRIVNNIAKFDCLSVREESGKRIIKNWANVNVDVLIDPTMLLTKKDWDKVSNAPKVVPTKKYILCYFLGNKNEQINKEIKRISEEKKYEIIDLLNNKSKYYGCGPSEFIWLIKNSSLICSDSFHASVFAIIYNKSFVVFEREQLKMKNMSSRIDTLLSKFSLNSRKYNGKEIVRSQLEHDYTEAYKILKKERLKSNKFLKKALEINK